MSGETEQQPSSWTVDTLAEYINKRFDSTNRDNDRILAILRDRTETYVREHAAMREVLDDRLRAHDVEHRLIKEKLDERHEAQMAAVQAALASAKEAVTKAERANERRFEAVNEFRAQLADIIATFIPKAEAVAVAQGQAEKIDDLKERLSRLETVRTTTKDNRTGLYAAIGCLGVVLTILVIVMNLLPARG